MAQDLSRLVVRLEAQSSQLTTELEKANAKIDRFASKTTATLQKWAGGLTAVFSIRAIANFAKQVIDIGDDLNDMAQKAGASVTALSQLGFAAKQNGSDLEGVTQGLVKLANSQQAALDGTKQQVAAFKALGVEFKNQDGSLRNSDAVFKDIAQALSQYADGAGKTAIAVDLLGKSGADLIPTLNLGADGLKALADESDRVGATITDKTAKALGDFNDQLDALTLSAQGVVASALAPVLKDIADALNDATKSGDGFSQLIAPLQTGFRLLADVGYSVYKTFKDVGTALGALGAASVAFATGKFSQARDIIKQANEDQKKSEEESNAFLAKLWGDRSKNLVSSADAAADGLGKADQKAKKTFFYGGAGRVSPVQEVSVTGVSKIETSAFDKLNEELNNKTKTQSETAISAYYEQKAALDDLYESGIINADKYNERLLEMKDTLVPEFEVTVKKIKEVAEKQATELNEFEKEAAKNTQDIIADTIYSGFEGGSDKILDSFADMLKKLSAQAIAANIGSYLFGEAGGGTKGSKGFLSTAASAIAGYFTAGGTKDSGGRGAPGMAYAIGTGAQPETFVPDRPGSFYPAGTLGGMKVTNNFYLPNNEPPSKRTQNQLGAAASRGLATANRRTN